MMMEFSHELTPYLTLISLFFTVAAIFACGYLLDQSFKKHPSMKMAVRHEHKDRLISQRRQNETNAVIVWIIRQMRRYDAGDDTPSGFLLESFILNEKQGGSTWKRNLHSPLGTYSLHCLE
ncbi:MULTISPECIES: hypothetical protein [Metabacillus]|uniref:hypothetical protein n=1 Tax=Metabacillus TaxID=2675233 RepID=UPI00126799E8|nr:MULTISPECIES: hypothetical protein [Metabacillus]